MNDGGITKGARFAKARVIKQLRSDIVKLAVAAQLPKDVAHLTATLHYRARDNRARDTGNLMATVKALVDGLTPHRVVETKRGTKVHVGYGMVADDSSRIVSTPEPVIHEAVKGQPPALWLEIEWSTK